MSEREVPLKKLFEEAKKKYKKTPVMKNKHYCKKCGKEIYRKDKRIKYCNDCRLKHNTSTMLTDSEYVQFKEYFTANNYTSVSDCVHDIIMEKIA